MKEIEKSSRSESTYYVLLTPDGYFKDAFEDLFLEDDECNYTFTDSIEGAYRFEKLDGKYDAPKYLWNDTKSIENITEALEYLGGEIHSVTEIIETKTKYLIV
ncbi:hypothetical protein [Paenibacillus odorifer]|uniref:hypothetical protein n=1 Tax=Paenibacillus odorifer TaxID=189426 RepID=UPI00096FCC1C|nr:hypothetical protein [Paenibacillus odorifer]OMD76900.1 hypothetical protein BSK50_14205 [Paenibacillus odorifer]